MIGFILDNLGTIAVGIVVLAVIVGIVVREVVEHKRGGGCTGNCAGCKGCKK